jgi:cellulose synthase/poly-beta-1,6-N-acetylglucosamine synthase-like glycosyltransferase
MVHDISIIIPVYRESKGLPSILNSLASQDADKEVIITVDEPKKGFLASMRRFHNVKTIVNKSRLGKARALNAAVKKTSGKVLLFLDSDVEIADDPKFLSRIIEKAGEADIIDFKKEVADNGGFLSTMAYYEYMTMGFSAWIISRFSGKCPAVCGSAFAMRREMFNKVKGFNHVVAEDIDIAIRAYLAGARFEYASDLIIRHIVHTGWKEWFAQRRRWIVGQALWQKKWGNELAKISLRSPHLAVPSFFVLYSSIIMIFIAALAPSAWMHTSLLSLSSLMVAKNSMAFRILSSYATANMLKFAAILISGFALTALAFKAFSIKMGFKMRLHDFLIYYFFYSPLYILMQIFGNLQVLLGKREPEGWKI